MAKSQEPKCQSQDQLLWPLVVGRLTNFSCPIACPKPALPAKKPNPICSLEWIKWTEAVREKRQKVKKKKKNVALTQTYAL